MIKSWKFRLIILAVISALAASAGSQDRSNQNTKPARDDRAHTQKASDDNDRYRDRDSRRERHRYGYQEFRKLMQEELAHLPSLNSRMQRLMDIQSKRHELQKQRQDTATSRNETREVIIARFHELLQQDLNLSDDARKIVQEITRNLPRIKSQIETRRSHLQTELEQLNSAESASETSSSQALETRRRLRYLDYLEKKLGDMETHPERLDLLARVLRGLPPDDGSRRGDGGHHRRDSSPESISDLKEKRKALQDALKAIDVKLEKLESKADEAKTSTSQPQ